MASFTDDPKALSKFNPYIQQQPVEQMIDVGRRRQAAHDEGVQKIQTQIDNIAGLDVVRDVDKAYLQSKINEMGNSLRSVAAGDFSNFQLINSVTGMTNQVAKDKGIQNGVQSAAKYRKEIAAMEAADKEGKGGVSNKWVFGKDSQAWLNSDDVNEAFSTKYQPYVDVNKKWMETMKSLHSDLQEQDIPYERNNDGSINYNKTAAAMQRISRETVSASKIANALSASMSPEELNQLNIDGRYTFRGATPEALASQAETKFSKQISENNDRIRELEGLSQLAAGDPERQKKAKEAIEDVKEQNTALQKNYEDEITMISQNPEGAKGMLYKNGAVAQFATANAWEHNKSNLLSNPVLEAQHWEKDYAMKKAEFSMSVRKQNWAEYMDKANYDLATQKELREAKKMQIELYGLGGEFQAYGGADTNIKDPLVAMTSDYNDHSAAASAGIVEMVRALPGTNSVQIKQALDKYQKGDPNWFKIGQDSKTIIPVYLQEKADEIIYNRKKATLLSTGIKQSVAEVENSPQLRQIEKDMTASVRNLPSIAVTTAGGRKDNFSQGEILSYLKKSGSQGAAGPLNSREKALENLLNHSQAARATVGKYRDAVGDKISSSVSLRQKGLEASLLKKAGTYIPVQESITFGSGEGNIARRSWENTINTALGTYGNKLNAGGATGGTEELTKANYDLAKSWVSGKDRDRIIYSTIRQGSKTFIQLSKDGQDVLVPIEKGSVSKLPNAGGSAPSQEYKDIVDAQMIGNGSTNPTGKFSDCYFDNTNIKGTRLNVGVDLEWNKSNNAKQYMKVQLNTPMGPISLLVNTPLDRDVAANIIKGLTTSQIKKLFLEDPNVSDKMKSVIKNM